MAEAASEMRSIESLQVGEIVLAGNPETGEVKECRILQTFVREVSQVFEVQIGDESIECSAKHPFWVVDQGWTNANRLQGGDLLTTSAGEVVAVTGVRSRLEKITVYNFEVEDLHTYFVSDLGILVHNTNCGEDPWEELDRLNGLNAPEELTTLGGLRFSNHALRDSLSRHGVDPLTGVDDIVENASSIRRQGRDTNVYVRNNGNGTFDLAVINKRNNMIVTAMVGMTSSEVRRLAENNGWNWP